jgi:CDP-diacylglycerol--glycerol-3-phosphate 3-phosphatidyltransferase
VFKARIGSDFDRVIHRVLPFLRRLPVHPDAITILGLAFAGASAVAFAHERGGTAAGLLAGAGLCDLLDGPIARSRGLQSSAGAFFDSTLDRVAEITAYAGIAVAMASHADTGGVLLVLWALGGSFMTSYARARAESRLAHFDVGFMERAERFLVLILGALTGWIEVALWVIALGSTATTLQRVVVARRLLRELDRTGRDPTAAPAAPEAR